MFPARYKSLLFTAVFFILFLFYSSGATYAQNSNYTNSNSNIPDTSHNRTQIILIDTASAIICQITGVDVVNPNQPCLGIDRSTNKIGFMESKSEPPLSSAIKGMTNLIVMTYDIPVHTKDYVSYMASGFSLVKPAYAQTTGFDNLTALMNLWKKVRDLTYLGFVLMFVLIGLGVMLRVKLDPRTVMSIQNQIPKAVIYLILITFSYAIAGLLIDGMWVTTFTGVNLITDGVTCTDGQTLTEKGTTNLLDNPIHYVNRTLGCPFEVVAGSGANKSTIFILGRVVGNTLGEVVSTTILSVFGDITNTTCSITNLNIGDCIKLGFQEVISWIIGFIMMLAIIVAVFVQLIRVWINLLKAYLQIILYTILAPIWIIAGVIPNNTNFGFTVWVRKMLASLAVYPIVIFLFLVAVVLASDKNIQDPNSAAGQVFMPPMVGNPSIADNMGFLLALGIILITPEVVNMTREMFKTSPSKYAPAAMAALGAGMGSAMAPPKKVWGALNARRQDGSASGPLAFAKDKFGAKVFKGVAQRHDILTEAYNRRFGGLIDEPLKLKKERNAPDLPEAEQVVQAQTTTAHPEPAVPSRSGTETERRPDATSLSDNTPAAETPPTDEEST